MTVLIDMETVSGILISAVIECKYATLMCNVSAQQSGIVLFLLIRMCRPDL